MNVGKFLRTIFAIGALALGALHTVHEASSSTPSILAADDPKLPTGG
jgi:hypothetical protein